MSANISSAGLVKQLGRKAETEEQVTEEHVQDPLRLVRTLKALLRDVAALKRRWAPNRIDFTDIVSNGTAVASFTVSLEHGFDAPVVWWVVRSAGTDLSEVPRIYESTRSTSKTLVLHIYNPATLTIRVEEAG